MKRRDERPSHTCFRIIFYSHHSYYEDHWYSDKTLESSLIYMPVRQVLGTDP